jgi:hypothetical protein
MAGTVRRRNPTTSAADLHRQWLELFDRSNHPERHEALVYARKDFEAAWEGLDRNPGSDDKLDSYRLARDKWVEAVLRDVIGWSESLEWGTVAGVPAQSPNRAVTVTAQGALVGNEGTGALVHVIDPTDSLRQPPSDLWAATPIDRIEALLRENGVAIGIVTDGRWWGLVHAAEGTMAASGIVDALTWVEEPRARDAFFTLASRKHIIGGEPTERLPALFRESVAAAEEITEALGAQVRRAVELLIQSFSESATEARRRAQPDPLPARTHDIYEAAVTVMMRVVFVLFAEERGLLPTGELFEQGYGISRELDRLVAESAPGEETLDATSLTWHRLLATSQALYRGASFENLRMPAYGGSLFDPDRFAFLRATTEHGTLAITVSDRVMLHVLRSVQVANVKGEARRISFRDIDVEQIGYIYEGLLGYTCVTVDETYLGLIGTSGAEPEIPLYKLEDLAAANLDRKKLAAALLAWIDQDQPSAKAPSAPALVKALHAPAEPSATSALTQTVGDSAELLDRISPWLSAIRTDLRGHPFVVLNGGLMVKETPSRRNAGAHYTPRSLAEEVVHHALQPLCYLPGPHQIADESAWVLRSSDELLGLKVADIACGSGAFLVAAARYLAERVVEAWIAEDPANVQRKGLYLRAIRQVVANCLYGADINDMAVEMCKLSLWLVSLDRDLPFSFVDDKVFLGNSLLGLTSLDQLRRLHISSTARLEKLDYLDVEIDATIHKAIDLRGRLATEIDDDDPARSSAAKHRQLAELHRVTADLRQIADGVIAVGLPIGGKPGRVLDDAYVNLRLAVKMAHPGPGGGEGEVARLAGMIDRGLTPTVPTDYERWQPLHWVIEAPDVILDHGGFDAIVGNPPFLGGQKLTGAMGTSFRDWLVNSIAAGRRGSADLVAYFFLRATSLLQRKGTLGLIATNTVAQGDSREVGLDAMVADGFTITRAIQSRPWPASSANLEYAAVWGSLAEVAPGVPRVADDIEVRGISTLLEAAGRAEGIPVRLAENAGIGFIGCYVLGMGFIIDPAEAQEWIAADARNAEVLFPYLNGEDLNSRPDASASRWVIDFNDRSEAEAASYELPFERVVEQVKAERAGKPKAVRDAPWWLFLRARPAMRNAIATLPEVLVIARVSKTVMPLRVPTGQIMSEQMVVFASDSYSDQAVLSSSLHQLWAITYGSTLETRVRYTPSDVFETFSRPESTEGLEEIGRILDEERREIMLRRDLGLTKLYNLVNDPAVHGDTDVDRLRELHVEIDEATTAAYGWADVLLGHGFHTFRQVQRWTIGPAARIESLDRLLLENQGRATETKVRGHRTSKHCRESAAGEVTLFD